MGIGQNFRFLTFNGYVSQHLRTATSGILVALEPLFGILFAVSLLGETLSFSAALGITIIMLATLGSTLLPKILKKSV